jgi:hypothetical protein
VLLAGPAWRQGVALTSPEAVQVVWQATTKATNIALDDITFTKACEGGKYIFRNR